MFDSYARSLFRDLPEFQGLTADEVARNLTRAYLTIIRLRTQPEGAREGNVEQALEFLRRLAGTVLFFIVLAEGRPEQERRAGAFVAAESIALTADYLAFKESSQQSAAEPRFSWTGQQFARLEAGLLYLYSRYDACAAGVVGTTVEPAESVTIDRAAAAWCADRLESLCRLTLADNLADRFDGFFRSANELNPRELEADTTARLYVWLGQAATELSRYLIGYSDDSSLRTALAGLDRLISVLGVRQTDSGISLGRAGNDSARIYHLATLMRLTFPDLASRALRTNLPIPPTADPGNFRDYISKRSIGEAYVPGRPVLWPSAVEFLTEFTKGNSHAVVSMPTGSGKSFVAELAISQVVSSGFVVYLAPTNALAEQIRGDLRKGLAALETEVVAFIGDEEYSTFSTDSVANIAPNTVAVMTPEKCALALRLSPDSFVNCRMVVFDECHLIGDAGTRGPMAELVMALLMLRAPNCRFVLMSAIVQNPQELANWLESATGVKASVVVVNWRPTRTLRSVLGINAQSFESAFREAEPKLVGSKPRKVKFESQCALAVNLKGAWQTTEPADYTWIPLSPEFRVGLELVRDKMGRTLWDAPSWVNGNAVRLGTHLAERNIQTLVFIPANRHYPFSNAAKTRLSASSAPSNLPSLTTSLQTLADYELGVQSLVFEYLNQGIAVHTSLMLEVEKIASEMAFKQNCVRLMYATSTLAQGLNLPAIAVVIAGTRIGDPRGQDSQVVEQRKSAQLLNAAGRAGRAGFANQGVVITIPDQPLFVTQFQDVMKAREEASFLQQSDNAVRVSSGLEGFLDQVCLHALRTDSANDLELQFFSLLTGGENSPDYPQALLERTFAAYLARRKRSAPIVSRNAAQHLLDTRDSLMRAYGAPVWLSVAAQKSGLSFLLCLSLLRSWTQLRTAWDTDPGQWQVNNWLDEFWTLIPHVPPGLLSGLISSDQLKKLHSSFEPNGWGAPYHERSIEDWKPTVEWRNAWTSARAYLSTWMAGESIATIAQSFVDPGKRVGPDRGQQSPIPKALSVGETWSRLAIVAGGFLSVAEQHFGGNVPLALACLPMCIKYGCDSPGTLAWFRHGVRLRRPSRLLARLMPPPNELSSDLELKDWVRAQRRSWLNGTFDFSHYVSPGENAVLEAVRQFIQS